jgi:NADH-quinone oxidoreductase subunit L
MAKDDIKKVLAASTMSQIGYMVLGAGLGPVGYAFAIMHLLTHGFFKAGMFLGAGSVMHGMDDEVNMRRYGGLRKFMPITFTTFGLGYLAIIGVPPFAGFYSKDKIIEVAFNVGGIKGVILGSAALLGAAVTAFYMTRVVVMTFVGNKRWDDKAHPHESPALMWVPMAILALGSVASGSLLTHGNALRNWLAPVVAPLAEHQSEMVKPVVVSVLSLVLVLIGVGIAILKYLRTEVPLVAPENVSVFTKIARRDLLQDDFNEAVFMRPGQKLTAALVVADNAVIDGAVRGVAALTKGSGSVLRGTQTGFVRSYAMWILLGAIGLIAAIWVVTL